METAGSPKPEPDASCEIRFARVIHFQMKTKPPEKSGSPKPERDAI